MVRRNIFFLFFFLSLRANSSGDLIFELEKNEADLIGPYLKYNFLNKPYTFGKQKVLIENFKVSEKNVDNKSRIDFSWPSWLGKVDEVKAYYSMGAGKNKVDLIDKKYFVNQSGLALPNSLYKTVSKAESVYFCLLFLSTKKMKKKICSDIHVNKNKGWVPLNALNKFSVMFNGKKAPRNAQISLNKDTREYHLEIKSASGFSLSVNDSISNLKLSSLHFNVKERSVIVNEGLVRKVELSFLKKAKDYLSRVNYYEESNSKLRKVLKSNEDSEIEFPYDDYGFASQFYGLSIDPVPEKRIQLKLDSNTPIATYEDSVILRGEKPKKLYITTTSVPTRFVWEFLSKEVGTFNKAYITLENKDGDKFYFSKRIYRGYKSSVAVNGTLTANSDGAAVLGTVFSADHWFESVFSEHSFFKQRWGVSAHQYLSFGEFTDLKAKETFKQNWQNVDLMARFNRGVRPLQSSFGIGARAAFPEISKSSRGEQNPSLLGIGIFWHTAPQKVVDKLFNSLSIFRYPKWLELSIYYYPIIFGKNYSLGFNISYHIRGRMMFSKRWFLDSSINIINLDIKNSGSFDTNLSNVYGSVGVGYFF